MPTVTAGTTVPKRSNRGYPDPIFNRVMHDLLKLTTVDENVLDSPFEGGQGVVSVPDRPVLSVKG